MEGETVILLAALLCLRAEERPLPATSPAGVVPAGHARPERNGGS